jgi:dTDP-4-dehydrorhamnose 3,5-epimerase
MANMEFIQTEIPDIILVKPNVIEDHRGFFMESYHIEKFKIGGINCTFVQDNHAKSVKNTLRGLHFQVQYPQAKLLRCLKGKVFDVAVDIRQDSPYFRKWVGKELSEENRYQLYIPEGFAHGYYVMSETAEIAYKCSEIYHPQDEQGLRWDDPDIAINWPEDNPILSEKDKVLPMLADSDFKTSQTAV